MSVPRSWTAQGFPVFWAQEVSNRTDSAENDLQSQEEYFAWHLPRTWLSIPKVTIFLLLPSFSD